MRTRQFGKTGVEVGTLGYGPQWLSLPGRPPEAEALDLIDRVLAAGVTFLDTADTYCTGPADLHHNERLIARALARDPERAARVIVATKGSTVRTEGGWEIDGSP